MGDFRSLLASQVPWLERRVRIQARAWGLDDLGADLLQETVMIALDRTPRFFQGPSRNEEARMRCLLLESMRSAATNLRRQRAKTPVSTGDELPSRSTVEDPESLLAAEQHRAEHIARARAELTANIALAYLCVYFPAEVREEDLVRAAAFRGGGAQGIARPAEEAWRLFCRLHDDQHPRVSETEWKRLVVEVLRSEAPLGEATNELVVRGIRNLDTQLARARARLGLERPGAAGRGQTK